MTPEELARGRCNHDLAERETACADGMCPLCAASREARLREALAELVSLQDGDNFHEVHAADAWDAARRALAGETK